MVIQSLVKEGDLNLIPPGPDYLILSVQTVMKGNTKNNDEFFKLILSFLITDIYIHALQHFIKYCH